LNGHQKLKASHRIEASQPLEDAILSLVEHQIEAIQPLQAAISSLFELRMKRMKVHHHRIDELISSSDATKSKTSHGIEEGTRENATKQKESNNLPFCYRPYFPPSNTVASYKSIGMLGSLAIAVNSLAGPAILQLTFTYHHSGVIPTTVALILVAAISTLWFSQYYGSQTSFRFGFGH
jgi:hypothetical protein